MEIMHTPEHVRSLMDIIDKQGLKINNQVKEIAELRKAGKSIIQSESKRTEMVIDYRQELVKASNNMGLVIKAVTQERSKGNIPDKLGATVLNPLNASITSINALLAKPNK